MSGPAAPGRPGMLVLPDGRHQGRSEYGDPGGRPVLYCHGFPAASAEGGFTDDAAKAAGVRVIAPDRPGFGASTPRAYPRIADWCDDLPALLDALGVERLPVLGLSGGAPYALAAAARLPGRVSAVALVGGLGPLAEIGTSAGMSPLGRLSAWLAARQPAAQAAWFTTLAALIRAWPPGMLRVLSAGCPGPERALLARPRMRAIWIAALRASVSHGARPAIGEMRRYVQPWGFGWAEVTRAVALWHGDADDVVPASHSRHVAARLPRATLHELPGAGHFSAPIEWIGPILEDLLRAEAGA